MSVFLSIIGIISWFVALASFAGGKTVVHEVFAAVSFLVGVVSFAGAGICSKIDSARAEATSERGQMQDELKAMRAALERTSPPPPVDDPAAGVGPQSGAW